MAKEVDITGAKNKAKGMASSIGSNLGKMGGGMMSYGKKKLFVQNNNDDDENKLKNDEPQKDTTTTTEVKKETEMKNIRDWNYSPEEAP